MLERRSALEAAKLYKSSVLEMGEVRGFSLIQVAGYAGDELPAKVGSAVSINGRTIMRIGPDQCAR